MFRFESIDSVVLISGIYRDYEVNPVDGQEKWLGKCVEVSGEVTRANRYGNTVTVFVGASYNGWSLAFTVSLEISRQIRQYDNVVVQGMLGEITHDGVVYIVGAFKIE